MEFKDRIEALSKRSKTAEKQARTEEATKTSVILPFLQALGFDVFDLDEVIPEYVADVGAKKGEKVDFAIKIDGEIAMLVEAKPIGSKLSDVQFTQLFRYFSVTDARLAILTNGREVWFFSDIDAPNKMDKKPFFTFDFQAHDKKQIGELSLFQKQEFEIDAIITAASNLKYTGAAADYLRRQLNDPDDEFVRLIGKQIHDGSITKAVFEQLQPAIKDALDRVIRDRIQDKLSITFSPETSKPETAKPDQDTQSGGGIVTTEEETEAFMIIRAIGSKIVPVDRIHMRDAKNYCAIFMDDNNRKPICRLHFNSVNTKSIGIFDGEKNEAKHRIECPRDIYQYVEVIEAVVKSYKG